jgi:hypothetical protein
MQKNTHTQKPGAPADKSAKNPFGKRTTRENAHAVYQDGLFTTYVLKLYRAPAKNRLDPYARAFCCVVGPHTGPAGDLGDSYIRDISGQLISGTDIR